MSLFVIRREVMDALDRYALDAFRLRMARRMAELFPEVCDALGPEGTDDEVRRGVDKALRYGIEEEDAVELFLELLFDVGSDFDEDPELAWAKRLLRRDDLDGIHKVQLLDELLS